MTGTRIREALVVGLLSLAPVVITLWVLTSIVQFLDRAIYAVIPVSYEPMILGVPVPGLGIVVTFALLLGVGFLARTVLGTMLRGFADGLLSHIPIVSALYGTAKQISEVFFKKDTQTFHEVVYVPFPSRDCRALAFVANHPNDHETVVFVPTAPNPTGGYVLVFKNTEIEKTPLAVDEALKIILSCGALK